MKSSASVVVLRWFPSGAGYAYDARLAEDDLALVAEALAPVLGRAEDHQFRVTLPDGRFLLGDRRADRDCLDERARHRQPAIVRAALVERRLTRHQEETLRRRVADLPLPPQSGRVPGLAVSLPAPMTPPRLDEVSRAWSIVPWMAAALVMGLEAFLQFDPETGATPVAWLYRGGLLLMMLMAWFTLQRPSIAAEELAELERELIGDGYEAPGRRALVNLLDDGARVVLPDGQVMSASRLSPGLVRRLPLALAESAYGSVTAYPGLAIVQGTELAEMPEIGEVRCAFVRTYEWSMRRWRLTLVQWTALEPLIPAALPA